MNEAYIFMIDTMGGVKNVPFKMVKEKEDLGWILVPQDQMAINGKPKQTYYPQYDKSNKLYKALTPEVSMVRQNTEILPVEVL